MQHTLGVRQASFSPDGQWVVTASDDRQVRLWDAATGAMQGAPLPHPHPVVVAAFHPRGDRILTACSDELINPCDAYVWDVQTRQVVVGPLRHKDGVTHAAFSADGTHIVTTSEDSTARVWDANTGVALSPPLRHANQVLHGSLSHDGRWVVTASKDGTARVWDAATGQPITPPLKHLAEVTRALFSPDGRRVLTASADHSAGIWELVPAEGGVADLISMARVFTSQRIDATGGLLALEPSELESDWRALGALPRKSPANAAAAWHARCAAAAAGERRWNASLNHIDRFLMLRPEEWMRHAERGRLQAEQKNWGAAAVDFQRALDLGAEHDLVCYCLALVQLAAENKEAYRRTCADIVRRFGQSDNPNTLDSVAIICTLAEGGTSDPNLPVQLVRKALAATRGEPSFRSTLGLALYRAGRYEEAVAEAEKAHVRHGKGGDPWHWVVLAMGYQRLGRDAAARQWLATEERLREYLQENSTERAPAFTWYERLDARLRHQEAKNLIQPGAHER